MIRTTHLVAASFALSVAALPLAAQAGELAERVAAQEKAFEDARQRFRDLFRQAETEAERERAQRHYPDAQAYVPKFLALAEEDPAADAALRALRWLVRYGQRADRHQERALELLAAHHLDHPDLASVCARLILAPSTPAQRFLERALAQSPHREVKGQACYALGVILRRVAPRGDATRRAEQCFERVLAEFADLRHFVGGRSLAEAARGDLDDLRHLSVGHVAPEIAGEDIAGEPFALSDYRGKVVLLDFWGDW